MKHRSLYELLEELRNHPEVADYQVVTYRDAIENYMAEIETMHDDEVVIQGVFDLDLSYKDLSEDDKQLIKYQIEDYYDTIGDLIDKNLYGSIDNLPDFKKKIEREARINAILKK